MIGLKKGHVWLYIMNEEECRYAYEIERQKLSLILKGRYLSIEHVGSTAVPGLLAKPIIDIAIGIPDFNEINSITSIMMESGYQYLSTKGEPTRRLFVKTLDDVITHHIHVERVGGQNWNNHILFRDKLLESSELRGEYTELKMQLLNRCENNRERYTQGKADFIQRVIQGGKISIQ